MPTIREQLEQKYGGTPMQVQPTGGSVRARLEAKYKTKSKTINPYNEVPVLGQLSNLGIGIGTAIGKAGLGLGQTALKGVGALSDVMSKGTSERYIKPLVKNIESIKQNVYDKNFEASLQTGAGKTGEFLGTAATYLAPSAQITRGQQAVTNLVSKIPATSKLGKFGVGALGVVGRAVPEAVGAGATGLAISGGDTERGKQDAFIAGALSSVFGTIGAVGRGLKETGIAKSVLSKTSGIPKTAFDAVDGKGINLGATPESALDSSRKAVQLLRRKNTALWQESLPKIAETYKGQRISFDDKTIKRLTEVADNFGVDPKYIPQNLKNVSALEAINLMKGLNELDSLAVKLSPKGAVVRQLKNELKPRIIKNFGGNEGFVSKLWSDYTIKSKILENMDSVVQAYKTKPTQTVTAKNRLMAIFDDNKPEFLKAVKDIEEELGINLTRDIASTKFKNILPKGVLKADGGLPTQATIVDKIIKSILLPITSPKLVGKLAIKNEGVAGNLEKRFFGGYLDESNINPAKTQSKITTPTTILNKNNISPNIPPTIQQAPEKSMSFVDNLKQKYKDIPNKKGGFIKNPLVEKKPPVLVPKSNIELPQNTTPYKTKKSLVVKDIQGNKIDVPEGTIIKAGAGKGSNSIIEVNGKTYTINKGQFDNLKGQSVSGEAKPFAPELEGVEETVKGASKWQGDELYDDGSVVANVVKNDDGTWSYQSDLSEGSETFKTRAEAMRDAEESATGTFSLNETKYSQYTLPDGENYREVLIKAPKTGKEKISYNLEDYDKFPEEVTKVFDKYNPDIDPEKTIKALEKLGYTVDYSPADFFIEGFYKSTPDSPIFKSSHWDEPNVISHLRLNERTYNGKKVTFMEELQSDWAREARRIGTIEDGWKRATETVNSNIEHQILDKNGDLIGVGKTPEEALENAKKYSIPNNPLLKNWQELSVKRALKEAVDNNSEYFAWINGEQTSARYNLATHIDEAKWGKTQNEGIKNIQLIPNDKSSIISIEIDNQGKIIGGSAGAIRDGSWKGKKLDEVLGKGLADKIMEKESGTLSGEGLKFGGEWANNLYDKQVGNIVKDLTGAKIEMLDMGLPVKKQTKTLDDLAHELFNDSFENLNLADQKKIRLQIEENLTKQQGIKLTPEIKAIIRGEAPFTAPKKLLPRGTAEAGIAIPLIFLMFNQDKQN